MFYPQAYIWSLIATIFLLSHSIGACLSGVGNCVCPANCPDGITYCADPAICYSVVGLGECLSDASYYVTSTVQSTTYITSYTATDWAATSTIWAAASVVDTTVEVIESNVQTQIEYSTDLESGPTVTQIVTTFGKRTAVRRHPRLLQPKLIEKRQQSYSAFTYTPTCGPASVYTITTFYETIIQTWQGIIYADWLTDTSIDQETSTFDYAAYDTIAVNAAATSIVAVTSTGDPVTVFTTVIETSAAAASTTSPAGSTTVDAAPTIPTTPASADGSLSTPSTDATPSTSGGSISGTTNSAASLTSPGLAAIFNPTSFVTSGTVPVALSELRNGVPITAQTIPSAHCFILPTYSTCYTTPDWWTTLPSDAQTYFSSVNAAYTSACTSCSTSQPLSAGAKGGIAVGAIGGAAALMGLLIYLFKAGLLGGSAAAANSAPAMSQGWSGVTGSDPSGGQAAAQATQGWSGVTGSDPTGGAASQGWSGITGGGDPTGGIAGTASQGWTGATGAGAGAGWSGATGAAGAGGGSSAAAAVTPGWVNPVTSAGGALLGAVGGSAIGAAAARRRRSQSPNNRPYQPSPQSQSSTPSWVAYKDESGSGRPLVAPSYSQQPQLHFDGPQQVYEAGHQSYRPSVSEADSGSNLRSEMSGDGRAGELGGVGRSELSGEYVSEAPSDFTAVNNG